jgi:hypothetical protein
VDAPVYTTRPGDFHVPGFHVPGSHVPGFHVPDSHVPGSHVPDSHVPDFHVQVAATDKLMLGFEVRFITQGIHHLRQLMCVYSAVVGSRTIGTRGVYYGRSI